MRQGKNPYLPCWEYIPDGEPKVFDGRVYIYGSHDEARGKMYCTGDYVCWSAPVEDLNAWTFEGVIYRTTEDPSYAGETVYYLAPDCTKGPDGRYYLYYFSSKIDKIAVAVCDTPAGHYQYYGDVHFEDGTILNKKTGFGLPFDPAILSDESGNWMYYGFALQRRKEGFPEGGYLGGFVTRLADDMLTIIQEPKTTIPGKMNTEGTGFEGHGFLEASSIRHYHGKYYLVYSSELGHELCYAVSDEPDRDFVYQGTIISNGDVGMNGRTEEDAVYYLGNNHGGLVQVKEDYYIFYHRHSHGTQYSRQGCAEPITMEADGRIPQVEITSQGLNGEPWNASGTHGAETACYLRSREGILHYSSSVHWNEAHPYIAQEHMEGVATLQNQFIYNLRDGAICGYKYLKFLGTEQILGLRVRGDFTGKVSIKIKERKSDGTLGEAKVLAEIKVTEQEQWHYIEEKLLGKCQGTYAVYFEMTGTGVMDLDEFSIG